MISCRTSLPAVARTAASVWRAAVLLSICGALSPAIAAPQTSPATQVAHVRLRITVTTDTQASAHSRCAFAVHDSDRTPRLEVRCEEGREPTTPGGDGAGLVVFARVLPPPLSLPPISALRIHTGRSSRDPVPGVLGLAPATPDELPVLNVEYLP